MAVLLEILAATNCGATLGAFEAMGMILVAFSILCVGIFDGLPAGVALGIEGLREVLLAVVAPIGIVVFLQRNTAYGADEAGLMELAPFCLGHLHAALDLLVAQATHGQALLVAAEAVVCTGTSFEEIISTETLGARGARPVFHVVLLIANLNVLYRNDDPLPTTNKYN